MFITLRKITFTGTNPASRLATMASFVEDGNVEIGELVYPKSEREIIPSWTIDWAKLPDGRIYSNKAPGPAFLGIPVYYLLDFLQIPQGATPEERILNRYDRIGTDDFLLSVFLQVIPWILLVAFVFKNKKDSGMGGRIFFFVSVLTGTTTSVFAKTFFGHSLAGLFVLSLFLGIEQRRLVLGGFCWGLAVLSEYSCALLVFPLVFYFFICFKEKKFDSKDLKRFCLGGFFPFVGFVTYHQLVFGAPWNLPNAFQNPEFVSLAEKQDYGLGGIFSFLPSLKIIGELLWGQARGLLYTQPWVLVLIIFTLAKGPKKIEVFDWVCLVSFFLFVWMNSSFNGWHGGSSPGPRYLSPILPLFCLMALKNFPRFSKTQKVLLWMGLVPAVYLYISIMNQGLLHDPSQKIWDHYLFPF